MSFLARIRRLRRGSSMAEMMVAGGILAAGVVPLFGFWVKLTRDTGSVTSKARAFRAVQEVVDRYQALGPAKLLAMAGDNGALAIQPTEAKAAPVQTASAGRFGAALRLDAGAGIAGAPATTVAAAIAKGAKAAASAKVSARLTREDPLLRLVVESQEFPELKVERLLAMPVEPAAPAWQ